MIKVLYHKIYNDVFDGGEVFEFGVDEEEKYFVQVKEGVSVEANSDIFLVCLSSSHFCLTFSSLLT